MRPTQKPFLSNKNPTAGLYRITVDGRAYYGCAENICSRWLNHKSQLRRGMHPNKQMQEVFDRLGIKAFDIELLEREENKEARHEKERALIEADSNCFNFFGRGHYPDGYNPQLTCPHCGKTGAANNMRKTHFDNCKVKQ